MFNVSTLLLDDALKPATPLTSGSGVIIETLWQFAPLRNIYKVVQQHTLGAMRSLVMVLLEIFSWFLQWNNFENGLIFDKVKAYKNCVSFCGHFVYQWCSEYHFQTSQHHKLFHCVSTYSIIYSTIKFMACTGVCPIRQHSQ